jgi:hypothetical protein
VVGKMMGTVTSELRDVSVSPQILDIWLKCEKHARISDP